MIVLRNPFRRLLKLAVATVKYFIPLRDESSSVPRDCFYAAALGASGSVLDIGTRQAREGRPTHSFGAFPNVPREKYVMADIAPGPDVDVVADAHALPADWKAKFSAFVAIAVFEHLERPWLAAREVARVLVPGGFCYVATHQTYPLHGYPSDYFRFSKEALALIFADAGLDVQEVAYEHRAKIIAPSIIVPFGERTEWNRIQPSYLVVHLFARKRG